MGSTNLLGLRIGGVTKADADTLSELKVAHEKAGKTSAIIVQALEYLGVGGGDAVALPNED
jgi:hypothetical protein